MSRRGPALLALALALVAAPRARADEDELEERRSWAELWLVGPRSVAVLGEGDPVAREHAALRLGTDGAPRPAVRALLAARADESRPLADAALEALVRRGGPEAVQGLAEALGDGSARDRLGLRHALAAVGGDTATRAVLGTLPLGDPDGTLTDDLARLGPPAVPRLLRAATDERLTATSPAVLLALGTIGDPRALPVLVHALAAEQSVVRIAAAVALGRLGDARASAALVTALADPAPSSVVAVLDALAAVGEPDATLAVRARLAHPDGAVRAAALRALVAIDAPGAVNALAAALAGADAPLAAAARDVLLGTRHPALVPLLASRLARDTRPAEVAGALAVLDGGAGVPVLLAAAARPGPARADVLFALAVAARTQGGALSPATRDAIRRALVRGRAALDPDAALVARALALDAGVAPYLVRALASPRASRRAASAHALGLLAPSTGWDRGPAQRALAAALAAEPDDEAFRREALAAASLDAPVSLDVSLAALRDDARAPEALALTAVRLGDAEPAARRRALVALHDALHGGPPRTRAAAAHAVAVAEGTRAAAPLLAALDADADRHVRRALAHALGALCAVSVPALHEAVLGAARLERDPVVRDALLAPAGVATRGREVLHVRFTGAHVPILADVLLPDGRALRIAPLPSGDLVLADLPAGDADVVATERTSGAP